VLIVGNALDEVDERGRQVTGDTLLILLNAHHEEVPFSLPLIANDQSWVRAIDTIDAKVEERRFSRGATYPVQGRTLVVFTLNGERRHRRATDAAEAAPTGDRSEAGHLSAGISALSFDQPQVLRRSRS
jgi:glycogen operon protein